MAAASAPISLDCCSTWTWTSTPKGWAYGSIAIAGSKRCGLGVQRPRGAADVLALDPQNRAEAPATGADAVHGGNIDARRGKPTEHGSQGAGTVGDVH